MLENIDYNKFSNYYDFDSQILFKYIRRKFVIDEIQIKSKYANEISYLSPKRYGFNILKLIFRNNIKKKK